MTSSNGEKLKRIPHQYAQGGMTRTEAIVKSTRYLVHTALDPRLPSDRDPRDRRDPKEVSRVNSRRKKARTIVENLQRR